MTSAAFAPNAAKRDSRYFYHEFLLPSLPPVDGAIPSLPLENHLPLLYTNDPMRVSRWLADHVPSSGCTLGFDVEVRCTGVRCTDDTAGAVMK
jgi:hypothetical protein